MASTMARPRVYRDVDKRQEQGFSIDYSYMDDSSIPVVTPEEGCTIIHTEVNGCPADFYQMPDDKDGNVLVILDEEANICLLYTSRCV